VTPVDTDAPTALQVVRRRGRVRSSLLLLGPAFVAAIAYVDPGNFATNFSAGAQFGYLLVWVIVAANAMAMLIQSLSGKIGLATGRNLPELCREHFPRPVTRGLWVQAELVAMATTSAEIIGGAIALNLLFGLPLLTGGLLTAAVAFALLSLQGRGYRPFELAIAGLFGVIALGFAYQACGRVDGPGSPRARAALRGHRQRAAGDRHPGRDGHAARHLPAQRADGRPDRRGRPGGDADAAAPPARRRGRRHGDRGLVNLAMLVLAARLFFGDGVGEVDTLEGVHAALDRVAGAPVALAFAVALLASGFASSGVGTYAGQVVMQGFLQRRIPLTLRRAITMAPALLVLALGGRPDAALVLSQVVLSFGIPFALVPLVLLTRRVDVMGAARQQAGHDGGGGAGGAS
jgi:manganese transport protein